MKKFTLLLLTSIILLGLCACKAKPPEENYFGGEGELKPFDGGYYFYDNNNIYSSFGHSTLTKYNKSTNTLSVACDDPTCNHESPSCKAQADYCVFNGELIKIRNESVRISNGIIELQGCLYLCGEDDKQVYKNELPEDYDLDNTHDNQIGFAFALGDDYLMLFNGGYFHVLDTDFNIAYTVIGAGSYLGGVYYMGNEIYYIDNLYRLMKLDMESGEPSLVDINGMKIWEGTFDGDLLWFSNGEDLCTFDYKTGEVKIRTEHAFFLNCAGRYIMFSDKSGGRKGVYLFDKESGEVREWPGWYKMYCFNGDYYTYDSESGTLTLYEDDLTTVKQTAAMEGLE